jgi:hypothetical protein
MSENTKWTYRYSLGAALTLNQLASKTWQEWLFNCVTNRRAKVKHIHPPTHQACAHKYTHWQRNTQFKSDVQILASFSTDTQTNPVIIIKKHLTKKKWKSGTTNEGIRDEARNNCTHGPVLGVGNKNHLLKHCFAAVFKPRLHNTDHPLDGTFLTTDTPWQPTVPIIKSCGWIYALHVLSQYLPIKERYSHSILF